MGRWSLPCLGQQSNISERESKGSRAEDRAGRHPLNSRMHTAGRVAIVSWLSLAVPALVDAQDPKPSSPPAPTTQPGRQPLHSRKLGAASSCVAKPSW